MFEPWDPDRRATNLAAGQDGALSHQQALASGLSPRQVDRRVGSGRWLRASRGVYVIGGSPDTWRQRAQVARLWAGDDGRLTHFTCARLHGLGPPSPLPHVTIPRGRSPRGGVAIVHRAGILPVDRATVEGLPTTTVSRLLVDLAGMLDGAGLEAVIDDALCRKLASPSSVLAAADRVGGGRKGLASLRRSLEVWTEAIAPGSVAEMRLVRLLGELGFTELALQYEVIDVWGEFVARLDLAVPDRRRAFEYDGVGSHGPRRWDRDETRYQRLREAGWEVESVTKLDLLPGERRLRDIVARWRS